MRTKRKDKIAAIGVDRGGTWTRVTALSSRLRPIRTARFRSTTLRELPLKLLKVVSRWTGAEEAPLVVATRGAFSKKWKKTFLTRALAGKLMLVDVISDAEAAHFAAFSGEAGLLLIAGTGSVAFSGKPGSFIKTGGFNPPKGDPGSGSWLGRRYLGLRGRRKEAAAMDHGSSAAYAKKLISLAEKGDRECLDLVLAAHSELASLLSRASGSRKGALRTALAGGLMNSAYFRRGFVRAASAALKGRRIIFVKTAIPAQEAAAQIALRRKKRTGTKK